MIPLIPRYKEADLKGKRLKCVDLLKIEMAFLQQCMTIQGADEKRQVDGKLNDDSENYRIKSMKVENEKRNSTHLLKKTHVRKFKQSFYVKMLRTNYPAKKERNNKEKGDNNSVRAVAQLSH